ncbi:glutathione S-transferase pi 1 [Homo sapiens]|uniref:Glutathione S-transferase pi 1 n=1 Tax=Homo sapiens TaxID=9606 RepID=A0A2R8Y5E5_HUMAN|nr:glutathione S-transferase pi 1 [Homo sapiens]KAI4072670.1 glutathione S-transferase pi 1 [Homo sapiens]
MPPYTVVYFPVRAIRAAPQVPGRRPHPVPVQYHPASPGPHPWALWEGPAGGSPGGHGE